jgi:plastocyanin
MTMTTSTLTARALASAPLVMLLVAGTAAATTVNGKLPALAEGEAEATVVYVEQVPEAAFASWKPPKVHLSQKGARFSPTLLPVVRGTEVDMTNDDWVQHSVYSYSRTKVFDIGLYGAGVKKSVTFDKVGVVELACFIHSRMAGVILVLQNPFFSRPRADGSFAIEGLPAGSYVLKVYRPGAPERAQPIKVPAKGAIDVRF